MRYRHVQLMPTEGSPSYMQPSSWCTLAITQQHQSLRSLRSGNGMVLDKHGTNILVQNLPNVPLRCVSCTPWNDWNNSRRCLLSRPVQLQTAEQTTSARGLYEMLPQLLVNAPDLQRDGSRCTYMSTRRRHCQLATAAMAYCWLAPFQCDACNSTCSDTEMPYLWTRSAERQLPQRFDPLGP